MTAQEEANSLWDRYNYYWRHEPLIAKQHIVINIIGEVCRQLEKRGVYDVEYWVEVKKIIYEKQ